MPILQLLDTVEDVDPNLADNDGNTPIIFAAQAGVHASQQIFFLQWIKFLLEY